MSIAKPLTRNATPCERVLVGGVATCNSWEPTFGRRNKDESTQLTLNPKP